MLDPSTGATGLMECMDSSGDLKITWNKRDADDVAAVRAQFDLLVTNGQHRAFAASADGSKGRRIDTFDPNAERIILVKQYQGG